ncbi:hypothetical protein [Streptomyces sp. HNM0574]|uniref:hypothetical protein n=1 Tax=Streptomyces sp. HNM0574 TaxID=2714954 RepID=UPI00146A0478|nr:hypothetical protein [Streptomyces sp. HNM0574]NLU66909.1 hypothetical protein [Streptomyces sp. HNM0574]
MSHRTSRISRTGRGRFGRKRSVPPPLTDIPGQVHSALAVDLPDEDLTEDLTDALELYVMGSKPRCEEAEYLELMEDAIDRIARES